MRFSDTRSPFSRIEKVGGRYKHPYAAAVSKAGRHLDLQAIAVQRRCRIGPTLFNKETSAEQVLRGKTALKTTMRPRRRAAMPMCTVLQ